MLAPAVSPEEMKRVKGLGFLHNRGTDRFSARIITVNGKVTAAQLARIAEASERFAGGEVTFTARLTVEVPGVPFDQIEPFREFIAPAGLETGGTGPKVRPVVACKGTTCQFGLIDTFALAGKIHARFYTGYRQVTLPHKFKIAVGGCPNNCVKPDLNDVGVMGQRIPGYDASRCRGCGVCAVEKTCPVGAARVADGVLGIDGARCNYCGRCIGKCPFGALETGTAGYTVMIGGRWGKEANRGTPLKTVLTSEAEVLDAIESAILLFREQGRPGERFASMINRLGFDAVQDELLSGRPLGRKAAILAS